MIYRFDLARTFSHENLRNQKSLHVRARKHKVGKRVGVRRLALVWTDEALDDIGLTPAKVLAP